MLQTTRVNKPRSLLVAGTPAKGESGLTTSERVSLHQRVMSKKKEQIISERFKKTNYGNDSLLDSSVVSDCSLKSDDTGSSLDSSVVLDCSSKSDDIESMFETNCGNKPRSLLAATPLIPEPVVPNINNLHYYWLMKEREKVAKENTSHKK